MKWIYPPKESSSKWKPWHVPWYIDNPSAEWNGCHHWLRWLLSTERHLLLGNKLLGRHWSNQNTVYAALIFLLRTTTVHHFKAWDRPRCSTENDYCLRGKQRPYQSHLKQMNVAGPIQKPINPHVLYSTWANGIFSSETKALIWGLNL